MKKEDNIITRKNEKYKTLDLIITICVGSLFGYALFLGGLINEKIKERKTNIKHLLYLSGSNSWSYWLAFFIIDYLKLLIFSFFMIIPIYIEKNSIGIYFLYNFLIGNASSLIFIYLFSFFGSSAKSGTKFIFLFLITNVIIILVIIFFLKEFNENYLKNYNYEIMQNTYNFNIFDYTPITSMISSFTRILFSSFYYDKRKSPLSYLYTSYIIQLCNFAFYLLLFILMETGYLRNFFNWLKLKFCLTEYNKENFDNYQLNINIIKKNDNDALIPLINNSNINNQNPLLENNIQENIKKEDNCFFYENEINNINLNQFLLQDEKNIQ